MFLQTSHRNQKGVGGGSILPDVCVTMETEQINVFFCFALLSLQKQQRETEGLVSFTNMSILI
jgi:hypothetical protein